MNPAIDPEPEIPDFAAPRSRCHWFVDDGSRPCGNHPRHYYGQHLAFCHIHIDKFWSALIREIRENPNFGNGLIAAIGLQDRDEAKAWAEHRRQIRDWPGPDGRAHCVYFAERHGFVKIGRTSDLKKRMHDVGKGSCMPQGMSVGPVRLLAVIHCACETKGCVRERFFHDKFRAQWLEGEWFLLDQALASFIGGLEECIDDRLREVAVPGASQESAA